MVGLITPNDEAQLAQTIEMFEVITQSQPQDYQSLEILKEAYVKLGREQEALNTSKRIAQAYVLMGQISSAILEYESILQRFPDDAEALAALQELESRAGNFSSQPGGEDAGNGKPPSTAPSELTNNTRIFKNVPSRGNRIPGREVDDGRDAMHKLFVEGKVISSAYFNECWIKPDFSQPIDKPVEPFIQILSDKGFTPLERSLRLLSDNTRLGYLPLDKYDLDVDLSRKFPAEVCRRWCVLPFDRLSKCILVATANPFNRQATLDLEEGHNQRMLWYLASPPDIIKALKKVFR